MLLSAISSTFKFTIVLVFINLYNPTALENLFIAHYETLDYPAYSYYSEYRRVRRSDIGSDSSPKALIFPIHTPKYDFRLILKEDKHVFHPDANLIVGGEKWHSNIDSLFRTVHGSVQGHGDSVVFGTIVNGHFRGTICLNQSAFADQLETSGTFYVEPSGFYFDGPKPFHSIIYEAKDVRYPDQSKRIRRSTISADTFKLCGLSDPTVAKKMMELSRSDRSTGQLPLQQASHSRNILGSHGYLSHEYDGYDPSVKVASRGFYTNRSRASYPYKVAGPNTRVCNLYLQSDTYLWDRVIKMQHVRGNRELAVKEITSIFTQHVQGAQVIYQLTVFRDHSGRLEFPGINFRVDRVRINVTEEDCKLRPITYNNHDYLPPTALPHEGIANSRTVQQFNLAESGSYADLNPFCAPNIDITNYLNLHSYIKHDDFCLAYVFTYRDFAGGTLGLAWVAEPTGSGGVCEKHRQMREGGQNVYKSLNTGVVTLLNYGSQVALKVSQLTFAHEMGHNFGAKHDDDHKNEPYGCLPSIDDPHGNYIMFASATSGDKENNNKFSTCSLDSIARLLDRVLSDENNCFLSSTGPFCGNQLIEEGEQCDCGFTKDSCRDKCCHPKVSANPCKLMKTVTTNNVQQSVQCSPTAGVCCTKNCQYKDHAHMCRAAAECHRASYCTGSHAKCPPLDILPDGTPCQNHTRVCKQGHCVGSICERIPGWQECSLTRDKKVTPELMCFVACKANRSGSPCISTYQLETDSDARVNYPQLVVELLRDGQGTKLPPGAPCDNYRGYCDVFLRCRSVDAEGPLARLRNLLFGPQMLQKVKTWITIHWWAVILIILGTIIVMIMFMKFCSVSTPSVRQLDRHRQLPFPPQTLTPFITHSNVQLGSLEHTSPVLWTVTTRPPRPYIKSNHECRSDTKRSRSAWPWDKPHRTRNTALGAHNHRCRTESTSRVSPSAPLDPLDFPPSNARQTPLPVASNNNNPVTHSRLNQIPSSSNVVDTNVEFRQHIMPRARRSRPISVCITPNPPNLRHHAPPLRKSKARSRKRNVQHRPFSEFIPHDGDGPLNCAGPSCQLHLHLTDLYTPAVSIGHPPPAYKDLVHCNLKHK